MIICITGMPASGKSSVGAILRRKGFRVYEIGDMIRELMKKEGIPLTPDSDREFTIGMRKKHGNMIFIKLMLKKVRLNKNSKVVIVGVRSRSDLNYIKGRGRVLTLAVVAPIEQRYERVMKRGRPDAPRSLGEFRGRDKKEERFGVLGAIKSADYIIAGTGTIASLKKNVEEILKEEARRY